MIINLIVGINHLIMKPPCSSRLSKRTKHSTNSTMPNKLFQRIFNSTLPDINLLTKTQRVRRTISEVVEPTPPRNGSATDTTRREVRTFKVHECEVNKEHPKITLLKEKMRNRVVRARNNEIKNLIYKSQIKEIQIPLYMTIPQKKETLIDSDEEDFTIQQKTISSRPATKSLAQKKLPVNYSGESKHFLTKIFEKQQYDDKFEEVNKLLLRNDYLYRCKGINMQVDRQWKY